MEIILPGVDPATFNIWANVLAEFLKHIAIFILSLLFQLLLSLYLRNGNKFPVEALGRVPGGVVDAFSVAKDMKWAAGGWIFFVAVEFVLWWIFCL